MLPVFSRRYSNGNENCENRFTLTDSVLLSRRSEYLETGHEYPHGETKLAPETMLSNVDFNASSSSLTVSFEHQKRCGN